MCNVQVNEVMLVIGCSAIIMVQWSKGIATSFVAIQ